MQKLILDGNKAVVILQEGELVAVRSENGQVKYKGVMVKVHNGKLYLKCDFRDICEIDGDHLYKVISELNQREIRNAPIEYLIAECDLPTLLDIVLLWGDQLEDLSTTAKYNLWHKLYFDGARRDCIFHNPKKQEIYDKGYEICKKAVNKIQS